MAQAPMDDERLRGADTPDHVILPSPAERAEALLGEHVADIVEHLNGFEEDVAAAVVGQLPIERAVEVLDQPELEDAAAIVAALPQERAATLITGMSADRGAAIFRDLEEPVHSQLLAALDPETRGALLKVLAYPHDTAGGIMTTEFVSVPASWTVAQVLQHVRVVERSRETVYAIYVLDPIRRTLQKSVSLRRLIGADPAQPILDAAPEQDPVTVSALTDREVVARLIRKYDLLAIPVVDDIGHMIGIVTVDDIMDAIIEEGTEDAHRFGGMQAMEEPYLQARFLDMIRKRAGWLCVLFISEMLTASAMQVFEGELEKAVVLTLFIPLIMSSGGNSGSQATSLLIRALALGQVRLGDWWRVVLRELPSGLTLGAILALLGIGRIALWQVMGLYDYGPHWMLVAATVGAALIGIVAFGSLAGSMLPLALKRIGFDPAVASAPFVATLVDVTGLVIYFSVALMILKGTLL